MVPSHLFIAINEPCSTSNPLYGTQFYLDVLECTTLDFIKGGECSRLHPTHRGCRNQVEDLARVEVAILLWFFAALCRKYNDDD